jgi:hypothetical protein
LREREREREGDDRMANKQQKPKGFQAEYTNKDA